MPLEIAPEIVRVARDLPQAGGEPVNELVVEAHPQRGAVPVQPRFVERQLEAGSSQLAADLTCQVDPLAPAEQVALRQLDPPDQALAGAVAQPDRSLPGTLLFEFPGDDDLSRLGNVNARVD